jgi:stress responsive alpha/beta barrel protein
MVDKVLRHVVMFEFKPGTTAEQVAEIEAAFVALKAKIPVVQALEWGTDVSVEGKAHGFSHCFFLTFKDEADRAVYLPHPEHKAFGELLHPHLEEVLVFDYWVQGS